MLRSAILIASVAHIALAAVGNVCAYHPYHQMQHYKDYEPAKVHCAAHYPVHVVTKTVHPGCLTTTLTRVISTDTVTARRTSRCPSPPHYTPPDESGEPVPYSYKTKRDANPAPAPTADAAPAPTALSKRDDGSYGRAKGYEWAHYREDLAKCGYECIRTACSCVATRKTVTRTLHHTCTTTKHTALVATETRIVHVEPHNCDGGYGGGYGGGHAPYGGPKYGGAVNGGPKYGGAVNGGPQHGGAVNGGPQHGGAVHGGPVHGGAVHGGPQGYHPHGYQPKGYSPKGYSPKGYGH